MVAPSISKQKSFSELIDSLETLKVLPHVVFKVLEISSDSDSPAGDIEKAIIVDPGFSSKVLVLANSAAFGIPKKVTSIKEAVMFLGFKNLRALALTVGTYDMFVGKTDKESLRRRSWWRHSVDTAVGARWLAGNMRKIAPDEAYTCGLLHLIGKTIMDRHAGRDYDEVTQLTELGISDHMAEMDIYGYEHSQVGSAAAKKWGLTETLQSALQYRQLPEADDPAVEHRACLALASTLAIRARGGDAELPAWVPDKLNLPAERMQSLCEGCIDAIQNADLHL
jgi:HD-like signal output (HDOD) protein